MKKIITLPLFAFLLAATARGQTLVPMPKSEVHATASFTNGTVIVSAEHPTNPEERGYRLFDGLDNPKWLARGSSAWAVYQFADGRAWAVTNYVLWLANDGPERDPTEWRLEGSNNLNGNDAAAVNAATWVELDYRVFPVQPLGNRYARLSFSCEANTTAYNAHRLHILNNAGGGDPNSVILGEWEMQGHSGIMPGRFAVVSAAPADAGCVSADAAFRLDINGQGPPVGVFVEWGTNPTELATSAPAGSFTESTNSFSTLANLMPDTHYFYRHNAWDGAEASTSGLVRAFTTLGKVSFPRAFAHNDGTTLHIECEVEHYGVATTTVTLWAGIDPGNLQPVASWPVATSDTCHGWIENCALGELWHYQFTAEYEYGEKTFFYADTVKRYRLRAPGDVKVLYWGGGSADIPPGTPLPESYEFLSGTWDLTTKNWSVDQDGSQYVAWENGAEKTAWFTPFVENDRGATVTLATNIVANRVVVPHNHPQTSAWNHWWNFNAGSPATLELAGENPEFYVSANDTTRSATLLSNVRLAAANGFYKGGVGTLNVDSVCDGVLGTVYGRNGTLRIRSSGSMKNAAEFAPLPGGVIRVSMPEHSADNAISPAAVVRALGGTFNAQENRNNAQAISQFILENTGGARLSNGNGELRATHPAAGIHRGPYGKGTLLIDNENGNDTQNVRFVVEHGVAVGPLLPWTWTPNARPLRLDAQKAFEAVQVESAPTNLEDWLPGKNYRVEGSYAPSNTLGSVSIDSLGFLCAPMTINLGANETLTITSGHVSFNHWGSDGIRRISGGTITTPAKELYVLTGPTGSNSGLSLDSALAGGFDLVKSGGPSLWLGGPDANTYSGFTYVNGGNLRLNKSGGAVAIPNNLVINRGGTVNLSTSHGIAPAANITVHEGGLLDTGNSQQVFAGVVTLDNGQLHFFQTGRLWFTNPGTGLVFANGGIIRSWSTEWGHQLDFQTDFLYGPGATNAALIATAHKNHWDAPTLRMSDSSMAPSVTRTFTVHPSPVLPAETPEMTLEIPLQSDDAAPVNLVKKGAGALALQDYSGRFRGVAKVLDGALLVNGPFTTQSVLQVTATQNNSTLNNIESTAGLRFSQPTDVWAGYHGGFFYVRQIYNANSIQISRNSPDWTNPGTFNATFYACGSLGRADVEVSGSGTLGGIGGVGGNVLVDGGTFEPGTPAEPQGQLFVGGNLDFINNGSWQVNLLATECNTAHIVGNVSLAGGVIAPNFDPAKKRPKGVWDIATYDGIATGRMDAPKGCKTVIDETKKIIQFVSAEAGTLLMVR